MITLALFRRKSKALARIVFLALCASFLSPVLQASTAVAKEEPVVYNPYTTLAQLYMPSMAKQTAQEAKIDLEIVKLNAERIKSITTIFDIEAPIVHPSEKLNIGYSLFASATKSDYYQAPTVLNTNTIRDLNLFCGSEDNAEKNIFNTLDQTQTAFGRIELQKMLLEPLDNPQKLLERQTLIRILIENESLLNSISSNLNTIKQAEQGLLWFWKTTSSGFIEMYNQQGFPHWFCFKNLNHSPLAVHLLMFHAQCTTATLGTIFGLAPFLFGYAALQERALIPAAIIGSIFSLFMSYTNAKVLGKTRKDLNAVHATMNSVAAITNACTELSSIVEKNNYLRVLTPVHQTLKTVLQPSSSQTQELLEILETSTFKSDPSFFSYQGRAQTAFRIMSEMKDQMIKTLIAIGQLDAYVSIAKLYKTYKKHPSIQFCFPKYLPATKPSVKIDNFWLPGLSIEKIVTNSVQLGQADGPSSMILTGPNAGGKSTSLKAITLAILLAQSFGIAPAQSMSLTPFSMISTYMNITDTAGQASLFQAEMRRTSNVIKSIQSLPANSFAFLIMDEVFTGTNPKEGQAGAYGVAKKLAGFDNSICIFATHFLVLTELEQVLLGRVENRKVTVIKNADGSFTFPYLLQPGITDQAIALDLLQQEGFDNDILQAAHEIAARQHKN